MNNFISPTISFIKNDAMLLYDYLKNPSVVATGAMQSAALRLAALASAVFLTCLSAKIVYDLLPKKVQTFIKDSVVFTAKLSIILAATLYCYQLFEASKTLPVSLQLLGTAAENTKNFIILGFKSCLPIS